MNESEFREKVHEELKRSFTNYKVLAGENLLYKLLIDGQGELQPSDFDSPKRVNSLFKLM